jgi:hypothetical protein
MKKILENERLKHYKKNFKEYVKTREGFTAASWGVGLLLVLIASLSLGHINQKYELAVMVFFTFVCKPTCFLGTDYSGYMQLNYCIRKVR